MTGRQLIFVLACLIVGCAKSKPPIAPVHPATGQVFFDGQPVCGAVLAFHPDSELKGSDGKSVPIPGATTDEKGQFAVSTFSVGDGLPPGSYRVTISCENRKAPKVRDEYPELLPARYQNPIKSGLKATIHEGVNALEPFQLKK